MPIPVCLLVCRQTTGWFLVFGPCEQRFVEANLKVYIQPAMSLAKVGAASRGHGLCVSCGSSREL